MKTTKLLLLIFSLLITIQSFGQRKYLADRYYDEFAYKKSGELYKELIKKGDTSQHVIKRLADSYYYNTDTEDAETWYSKLFAKYQGYLEPEYLFRYAQVLKSNGKYKESDSLMIEFRKRDTTDTRSKKIEIVPNYVSIYSDTVYQKKKKETINVHNVALNTKYSDFGGFLHGDKFYFASAVPREKERNKIYRWNNQPFLNMYVATEEEQTLSGDTDQGRIIELIDKSILGEPIQTRFHEATAAITEDGLTMYFTRDNYDGSKVRKNKEREVLLKLYKARLINGKWDAIEELPFNSDEYSTGHPALSPDEKTLYFISDRPDGYGYTDLYKVALRGNNRYGEVKNLGKEINTDGREMFPFISKDSVLYFSSDGHLGLGALDIFETKKIDDDTYTPVKNIQAPFNSKRDDFGFTVNKEKTKGFFSSNRKGGKGDDDIYSFIVAGCSQTIAGIVTDVKTGDPIGGATVIIEDTDGKAVAKITTKENGMYKFLEADCGSFYRIRGEKESYHPTQKTLETSGKDGIENTMNLPLKSAICLQSIYGTVTEKRTGEILPDATVKLIDTSGKTINQTKSDAQGKYNFTDAPCTTSITVLGEKLDHRPDQKSVFTTTEDSKKNKIDLALTALIIGNQIVINPIYFDYDKYNIREDAAYELEHIVTVMKNHPEMTIKIEAHTDSRGKNSYNRKLSDRRAKSTRDYIVSRGITANRLVSAIGYGEDQLLNKCKDGVRCSEEEHQENRRSYFYIVNGGKDIKVEGQEK